MITAQDTLQLTTPKRRRKKGCCGCCRKLKTYFKNGYINICYALNPFYKVRIYTNTKIYKDKETFDRLGLKEGDVSRFYTWYGKVDIDGSGKYVKIFGH